MEVKLKNKVYCVYDVELDWHYLVKATSEPEAKSIYLNTWGTRDPEKFARSHRVEVEEIVFKDGVANAALYVN